MFVLEALGLVSLLSAALCVTTAAAATDHGTVEIGLVFPQNETYAPSDVFPIVFAIKNPALALGLNPYLGLQLWHFRDVNNTIGAPSIDIKGANLSQSDPLFLYTSIANLGNSDGQDKTLYTLNWSLDYGNCSTDGESLNISSNVAGRGLTFTVAPGGQDINLGSTSDDACSNNSLAFNVNGTLSVTDLARFDGLGTCAVLSNEEPTPTGTMCSSIIDKATAASILATLDKENCQSADGENCSDDDKTGASGPMASIPWFAAICATAFLVARNR